MSDFAEKEFERMLRDYYRVETVDLQAPRDLWERVSKRLAKPRRPSLSLRLMERRYLFAAVAAAAVLAVFFALTRPGLQPTETVSAQEILERLQGVTSPLAVGVHSYEAFLETKGGFKRHVWFKSPDKFRQESYHVDPANPESGHLFVTDGLTAWDYVPLYNSVTIREADPELLPNQPPTSGLAETLGGGKYYIATLLGTEMVAGRQAYSLELQPTFTRAVSSSDPYKNEGLVKWWLDKETLFELRYEQYTTEGELYDYRSCTNIQYNIEFPDDLFTFQIPPATTVIDDRPQVMPTPTLEGEDMGASIQSQVNFTFFVPTYLPRDLAQKPEVDIYGPSPQVELFYRSLREEEMWLRIIETNAANVSSKWRGEIVDVAGVEGRLEIGDGRDYPNTLAFIKEGTYIALWSLRLPPEELLKVAGSMK